MIAAFMTLDKNTVFKIFISNMNLKIYNIIYVIIVNNPNINMPRTIILKPSASKKASILLRKVLSRDI